MAKTIKTSPGIVNLSCMIWEPDPIYTRPEQNIAISYSPGNFELFKDWDQLNISPGYNGIRLKEKNICYDTFLLFHTPKTTSQDPLVLFNPITGTAFSTGTKDISEPGIFSSGTTTSATKDGRQIAVNVPPMENALDVLLFDYNGDPLFNTEGQPKVTGKKNRWLYHQIFSPSNYPIFNPEYITAPKWTYGPNTLKGSPFDIYPNQPEFDSSIAEAGSDQKIKDFVAKRKTYRYQPQQVQTSVRDSLGIERPVHWLSKKVTPLYQGEDFFVEFTRLSRDTNVVLFPISKFVTGIPSNPIYNFHKDREFLNPYSTRKVQTNIDGIEVRINGAVLSEEAKAADSAQAGATISSNTEQNAPSNLDLSVQAYYVVQINAGDQKEEYWLIIPSNGKATLVQVGMFPLSATDVNGTTYIVTPKEKISKIVSTSEIDGSSLIEREKLRIKVQNHFGALVITFSGFEDKPWIVRNSIPDGEKTNELLKAGENRIAFKFYPVMVKSAPISIGAGNLLCGFTFSPMHYEPTGFLKHPQTFTINGPILTNRDLSQNVDVVLRSKIQHKAKTPTKSIMLSDADQYVEYVKAIRTIVRKEAFLSSSTVGINDVSSDPSFRRGTYKYSSSKIVNERQGESTDLSQIELVSDIDSRGVTAEQKKYLQDLKNQIGEDYVKFAPKQIKMSCNLSAGSVTVGLSTWAWKIPYCLTPLCTGFTINAPPYSDPSVKKPCATEVAQHVMNVSLTSTFSDNLKIEKSGSIRFIINAGQMTGTNYTDTDIDAENSEEVLPADEPCKFSPSKTEDRSIMLSNLSGKTFTIRLYAHWEGGFMSCTSETPCPCKNSPAAKKGTGIDRIIFTGLCHGGRITVENGKRYLDCQLLDYWKILNDSYFLNSPKYDGVISFNAIYEMLNMAGLKSTPPPQTPAGDGVDNFPPSSYVKTIVDKSTINDSFSFIDSITGQLHKLRSYGLPSSYDVLQDPKITFSDGAPIADGIAKVASLQGYICYFDRFGIFRYMPKPDFMYCSLTEAENKSLIKCRFYASPTEKSTVNAIATKARNDAFAAKQKAVGVSKAGAAPGAVSDKYGTGCNNYDSLALRTYVYDKKVSDVFNDILLVTVTTDGALVSGSKVNYKGKYTYTEEGYIGYTKRFIQKEGIFGSEESVEKSLRNYSTFFKPPIGISWESYGISRLEAGDLVYFTGLEIDNTFPKIAAQYSNLNSQSAILYITSLGIEINAENNSWTNKYEGEWLNADCGISQI